MTAWTPGWAEFPPSLLDFWTERHLATLTTVRPDGRPHVVPVGVTLDVERQCAWVITDGASVKARHLAQRPGPVAACQVEGARWATLEGTAEVHADPDSVARAVRCYAARYRVPRENPTRVAIRVHVERILCSRTLLSRRFGEAVSG